MCLDFKISFPRRNVGLKIYSFAFLWRTNNELFFSIKVDLQRCLPLSFGICPPTRNISVLAISLVALLITHGILSFLPPTEAPLLQDLASSLISRLR